MTLPLIILVFEVSFFFIIGAFGLRFVFYDEDGPNLDTLYTKYFKGRVRKRYAEFTRTAGWILLALATLYFAMLARNDWKSLIIERFFREGGGG